MAEANKRYSVVTGANKGIGFGICKQLASNGIVVILSARDEKRGLEAVEKLKEHGLSDRVVFHQLDVADAASVNSLAKFIKTQFGKLDILVNNAAVRGYKIDGDALKTSGFGSVNNAGVSGVKAEGDVLNDPDFGEGDRWYINMKQNWELAEECLRINYCGTKTMVEAFVPLLQLSDSPRIVNVSSSLGMLKNVSNERAREVLSDAENLTEERIDEVLNEYLKDFKDGSLSSKGWPTYLSYYILSKASINAYTRILAKKFPNFCINCVCPGFVRTDLNYNTGYLTVSEGADNVVRLALMPNGGPSGLFFDQKLDSPF